MKLVFSYIRHKGKWLPICKLDENHQLHPLTGYLNDPMGGLNYFSFLEKSLAILSDKNIHNADISSNSWGVEIIGEKVYFYFLFSQENKLFHFNLSREIMIDLLRLWLIFISQEAEERLQQSLEF